MSSIVLLASNRTSDPAAVKAAYVWFDLLEQGAHRFDSRRQPAQGGRGRGTQSREVDAEDTPVHHDVAAADNDTINASSVFTKDDLTDRIIHRHVVRPLEIETDDVRQIARRDLADFIIAP